MDVRFSGERRGRRWAAMTVLSVVSLAGTIADAQQPGAPACRPAGHVVRVAALPEASGLAVSRSTPGRLWAHNDSGRPEVIALDAAGSLLGTVRLSNTQVEDWEGMAIGGCPSGTCLYVGDIGDNDAERRTIALYRLPEPAAMTGSVNAERIVARYPDGSHNAETLLVTPDGNVYIVTKGDTGPLAIYRLPDGAKAGVTVTLERVGKPRERAGNRSGRITDGAVSRDGTWIALRTTEEVLLYRTNELLGGSWREAARISVRDLGEPQGEGIAFGDGGSLYLAGEGGGRSSPGTLIRLACTW